MKKLIFILLLSISYLSAYSAEYDKANEFYEDGEFEKAFIGFRTLAIDKKDTDAAYMLAYMFETGEGCHLDKDKALRWYRFSATSTYEKDKHRVDKDIQQSSDQLYNSLSEVSNVDTKNTLYQYMHSIFNIKAHHANYLIPMSMRLNGDYGKIRGRNTSANEVEFQISVKYDFAPNLLGFDEVYSVAYTQHSFWQYYVGDAYFRATDYNPEMFVTIPMNTHYFKAVRLSAEHTSNGLGRPDERAWNYLTFSSYFQYKSIFTELQLWYRMDDNFDYNPELTDTMGYGHIKFMIPYQKHLATLLLRNNFKGKYAVDTSYSYPLFGKSLFLYLHGFSGYGESMSSYAGSPEEPNTSHEDDRIHKIGIGFSISR